MALLFFTAYSASAPAQVALSEDAYRELREIVQNRIYQVCPPDKSYYITLGQSVTPIFAFLQNAAVPGVSALPLSKAAAIEQDLKIEESPELQMALFGRTLTGLGAQPNALRDLLFAHFDRFLPPPQRIGENKLCVIDFLITGKSMRAAKIMLTKYYRERFQRVPAIFTLALDERQDDHSEMAYVDYSIFLADYRELPVKMNMRDFSAVSPYGSYSPPPYGELMAKHPRPQTAQSPARELRPAYLEFRRQLMSRMIQDRAIKFAHRGCGPNLEKD